MFKDWKISTFNGVLMAGYFIPAWAIPSYRIAISPVRGLYERSNMASAMFVSDYLQLGAVAMVRFAWLLALAKLTVVAFFSVFLVLTVKIPTRNRGASDEALGLALVLGTFVSFASMLFAAKVAEAESLRLHATESLLLLSIGIVMLVETARPMSEMVRVAVDRPQNDGPVVSATGAYAQGI